MTSKGFCFYSSLAFLFYFVFGPLHIDSLLSTVLLFESLFTLQCTNHTYALF